MYFFCFGMVHTLVCRKPGAPGRLADHVVGVPLLESTVAVLHQKKSLPPAEFLRKLFVCWHARLASAKERAVYGRVGTLHAGIWNVVQLAGRRSEHHSPGHFDEPGCAMFPKAAALQSNTMGRPGTGKGIVTGRRKSRVSGAPEVLGEFPMSCLAEENPDAGRRPDKGAHHGIEQSASFFPKWRASFRGNGPIGFHGERGCISERNFAPRRCNPAWNFPAGRFAL